MTIKELQEQVERLYTDYDKVVTGKNQSKETLLIHLVEEVGELARQYVNQEHRKEKYDEEEVKNAIGDILINTLHLSEALGVDAETVVQEIMREDKHTLASKKQD